MGIAMTTYAVNQNGATTRYGNYGFDSFCKGPDGRYYGIKADGLYLLEGSVSSEVDFGDLDFGTSALKSVQAIYANCSSSQPLKVKVTLPDESSYTYAMRTFSENIKTHRADPGKGLSANYFGLSLLNDEAGSFELDGVEVAAIERSRRI